MVTNKVLASDLVLPGHVGLDSATRVYAYLSIALYDATEAAWDSKYTAHVIEKARADGFDTVWNGTVPTGRCRWRLTDV